MATRPPGMTDAEYAAYRERVARRAADPTYAERQARLSAMTATERAAYRARVQARNAAADAARQQFLLGGGGIYDTTSGAGGFSLSGSPGSTIFGLDQSTVLLVLCGIGAYMLMK